ncbi:hypothetical protein GCM10009789_02920 [Kribbella sancticallisti]|uniref:DUF7144 domain-containing protein n=1 Tax=Kribbella sancticallisti TaxID=460087 RepID=A0ABN2C7P9_9ACTN
MTEMRHSAGTADGGEEYQSTEVTGWVGWVLFAGVIMLINGSFSAIAGLVALFKDRYYLVQSDRLVISIDFTAWGWVHLLLGVLVAAAGIGALTGQTWARVVGVVLASVSAIVNFGFLAAYPLWSTIVIALDVFVIYALVVHGREAQQLR